jgi:hypothetical protein
MDMKKLLIVAVALSGCSVAIWAQGVRRDGRWEVERDTELTMNMPPTTMTQCI